MAGRRTEFALPPDADSPKTRSPKMTGTESITSFLGVLFEEDNKPTFRDPKNIRNFICAVFAIITVLLVIVTLCTVPFVIVEQAKNLVLENSWLTYVFLVIHIVPYFMLVCCESTRREFPTNIVLLLFLTIGLAGTCGCCTAWFDTITILYGLVLTIPVTIAIIILAIIYPTRFTTWKYIFYITLAFLTFYVITSVVLYLITLLPLQSFLYPAVIVSLFSGFLLYDVKAIVEGHRNTHITPTTYVMGVAQVFADVIGVFITFLEIIGSVTEDA